MRKLISSTMIVSGMALMAVPAQADDLSVSTSIDYVTEYVFRGVSLADAAIQPGVEVSTGGFYAGAWYSAPFGTASAIALDELDLYAGYGFTLSDSVSLDVGVTYYHYPQGGGLFSTNGGASGSYEGFAGLNFDMTLSPSLYVYYDETLDGFTIEGSVGHSVPMGESSSLDLGLSLGHADYDAFALSWEYAQASAAFSYAFTDDFSAYVGANAALNSEDLLGYTTLGEGDAFWLSVGVASGF